MRRQFSIKVLIVLTPVVAVFAAIVGTSANRSASKLTGVWFKEQRDDGGKTQVLVIEFAPGGSFLMQAGGLYAGTYLVRDGCLVEIVVERTRAFSKWKSIFIAEDTRMRFGFDNRENLLLVETGGLLSESDRQQQSNESARDRFSVLFHFEAKLSGTYRKGGIPEVWKQIRIK